MTSGSAAPGPSPLQHRNHTRQRRGVDRPVNDHPAIARKHDLHPPRSRRSHRDVIVGPRAQRRSSRLVAWGPLSDDRHKASRPTGALRFAKQPPPPEYLIGVEVAALGHHRHRNPRLMGLRHDLPLLRPAPPTTTTATPDTAVALRASLLLANRLRLLASGEGRHSRSTHFPSSQPAKAHPIQTGGLRRMVTWQDPGMDGKRGRKGKDRHAHLGNVGLGGCGGRI